MAPEFQASCEAFAAELGPCPGPGYSVDRRDNERGYEPGNLRWATKAEQIRNSRQAKLTVEDAAAIRADTSGRSHGALAAEYGVHRQTIGHLLRGKTWR